MGIIWDPREPGGYWLTPAIAGGLLILIGIMLLVFPRLLEYFVAALFMLAGGGVLGVAWRMRQRVSYRRIDEAWSGEEDQSRR